MDKQNYQQLTRTFLRLSRFSHLAANDHLFST